MATFDLPPQDLAWGDYEAETTERIGGDFTINALKNIHKNYKKKVNDCDKDNIMVISPGSINFENVVVLPDYDDCPKDPDGDGLANPADETVQCYAPTLVISPDPDFLTCPRQSIQGPEQVPFVLATRGIIFRNRNVPYFVSSGGTKAYMDEVIS